MDKEISKTSGEPGIPRMTPDHPQQQPDASSLSNGSTSWHAPHLPRITLKRIFLFNTFLSSLPLLVMVSGSPSVVLERGERVLELHRPSLLVLPFSTDQEKKSDRSSGDDVPVEE